MRAYQFRALLQKNGWIENAFVNVSDEGIITDVTTSRIPGAENVEGIALPGFQNAHSHAFQYAMAGIAENNRGKGSDNFWTWRDAMYRLALSVEPEDMEKIAAMVYAEMTRNGYTHVAEFHYLHHDVKGKPYTNIAEHGARLMTAAERAGIKITLVPVFYQKGGFGKPPLSDQKRFISSDTDDYFRLLEASIEAARDFSTARIGYGVHSIRAVEAHNIIRTYNEGPKQHPFHMHIAEQRREVEDSLAYLKKRPVEWLLENLPVNKNFHLVHATHLTRQECETLAHSGAHVVLCPSTEGNLGDGFFSLGLYQAHRGNWSIGTDSHVGLNPAEELRLLDYGHRLQTHQRNTFITSGEKDNGKAAFIQALLGGRKAMGIYDPDFLAVGQPLDAVVYDMSLPLMSTSSLEHILSTIIYCSDPGWILGTLVNGKWITKDHEHIDGRRIADDFLTTIHKLKARSA